MVEKVNAMERTRNLNHIIQPTFYLAFFLFSWIWLFRFYGYVFFFQEKSGLFLTTLEYLIEHLKQPGGFLDYLGQLQTSLYFYPLTGSLIVSLEIIITGYLIGKTGKIIGNRPYFFISFLITGALFYLQLNYQYLAFNTLGILFQILFFYLTVRYLKNKRSWIAVFVFPLLYFLTGAFSAIYLVMLFFHSIIRGTKPDYFRFIASVLLSGILFFAGREFLFYQTDKILIQFPFSPQHIGMQTKIFLPLIIITGLLPLIFKINIGWLNQPPGCRIMMFSVVPVLIVLITLSIFRIKTDTGNAHYFHVEKLFYSQQYNQITEFNLKHPSLNTLTEFFNNIALCETGKLNDRLFFYPQSPDGSTLFLKWEMLTEILKRGGYWYYCVGLVNEAQRWAYEYMVMRGKTPETIKMLIKTEIINGNYKVAEKYISVLKNTFFYRKEAKVFGNILYNEPAINSHPEYGKKRRQKPKSDFFVLTDNPPANLEMLIKSDSTNRAAIDYHFAWLLLQKNIPKVVENLPLLEKTGYTRMPLHIDEAATGFKLVKMGEFPKLQKMDISMPVIQRFDQFYKILQQNNSGRQKAQNALFIDFYNTFWYYYFFK
jgi:hypothetical protein